MAPKTRPPPQTVLTAGCAAESLLGLPLILEAGPLRRIKMKTARHFATLIISVLFASSILFLNQRTFSQAAQIVSGISYLKSAQNADGSWGGTATSLNGIFPTTAAALEALRASEQATSTNQTNAIQFLT